MDYKKINTECYNWWSNLQSDIQNPHLGNSGLLASLRRCKTPLEGVFFREVIDLCKAVDGNYYNLIDISTVAVILSHVHTNSNKKLSEILGEETNGRKKISDSRFKASIQVLHTPETLIRDLRRFLSMTDGVANVNDLAVSILDFLSDNRSNERKIKWIFNFYNT